MSLHFGSLYWPATLANPPRRPPLSGRVRCDALVVGGGMTGMMCGYTLAGGGIDTVLIEQGEIAAGSSAANTGLLQYSNDIMLSELAAQIGEEDAVAFYRKCKTAVEHLSLVAESLPRDVGFKRRSSLYYASAPQDVAALRNEFELLDRHGFGVEWWDEADIRCRFPFAKPAAIVTHGDGELNPYQFVTALAEAAAAHGLAVYEKTPMLSVSGTKGRYVVKTDQGEVHAKHIVYAVGYSPEAAGGRWVQAKLNRSYAIATKPLPSLREWHQRFLLWETARPYLYLRTTVDDRIVAGGLDETLRRPVLSNAELRQRSLRLMAEVRKLFPELAPELEYEWCATFGESADDLPWLGEDPDRPGSYYALGYGGNGTVYSTMAAGMIRDDILGRPQPIARIVRPDRRASLRTSRSF